MLFRRGRQALVPLLVTGGLVATSAACVENVADPAVTGVVIPSAPTRPTTSHTPTGLSTRSTPGSTATGSTTASATSPAPTTSPRTSPPATASGTFSAHVSAVTTDDVRHTYRPGCPVGPSGLRKITMTYRSYTGEVRTGVLIVKGKHAGTVVDIFRQAFDAGFRINRMDNPNVWEGDDKRMMAADNTSAFNCRQVTGNPAKLSPHSYGTAIDVNTRRNPYRAADDVWYPSNGVRWIDRTLDDKGMIRSSSTITRAVLAARGTWGGQWAYPDYQHFELD
ncbi:MAG: M15 family metallopeptidase [Terracoccus sp.]